LNVSLVTARSRSLNSTTVARSGSVTAQPRRDQMPAELNEHLVVEFYSR